MYITKALQFLFGLLLFGTINANIGFMKGASSIICTVGLAAVCAFLPLLIMTLAATALVLVHLYACLLYTSQAIEQLVKGFQEGNQCQTLLGVTGSGKTFTMANVIAQLNKPTLIIAHNKTLAAQLYGEFKEFFPNNAVAVSYTHLMKGC